ncbi:YggT family protein [Leptolyngbya iicbica]|uniref:YggT family protein n=2 Tax=Cyanophyceae TaxID=3028117 RepID=A0A4V2E3G4_9CYAN|nr:YggT family protein [Leptolyngbya sp. LK]RZM82350.1 YggT family protein [Leptolyngbya sp. LK]
MNQPPNRPQNPNEREQRYQLQQEREALILKQEKQRLKAANRYRTLAWIRNSIALLVGALEILLAIRFLLRISLANLENMFASFIMNLSAPFMRPFSTLFISPTNADASRIFDLNVLVAMAVYGLLGGLAIALVNYLQGPEPAQK